MLTDRYIKIVLSAIALFLGLIAMRPFFAPASASAQSSLNGVQFLPASSSFNAVNTNNGDLWLYSFENGRYEAKYLGQIVRLGQPLLNTGQAPR
ncbi:MAG TPA: hypothetical protein VMU19_01520 [Bryobacteraceae bacterium]|nr:hypothetical protein [Bryobacteraceae bacterium]